MKGKEVTGWKTKERSERTKKEDRSVRMEGGQIREKEEKPEAEEALDKLSSFWVCEPGKR